MSTQTAEKTSNITFEETSQKQRPQKSYSNWVKIWLGIGLFMIFVQVVVGGITRLTGSGLSITKWEIVTGTLPPLNAAQWQEAFDLYKATPQYEKINQGMSMPEFKFIYFWEYIHRLWARLMGFVFIIPFGIFLSRKMIDKPLLKRLGMVFLLAATVASFGWIMVASGLIERPWVDAYKLTMHLSLAFILYSYLLWTTFKVSVPRSKVFHNNTVKKWMIGLTVLTAVQIILGGVMSGTKAGLYFPTWPDMNGVMVPAILMDGSQWNVENLVEYDRGSFAVAFIQFVHRTTAYLLFFSALYFVIRFFRRVGSSWFKNGMGLLITMLVIQMVLGISTLLYSVGSIPVGLGVMHQAGALILLSINLFLLFLVAGRSWSN